MTLALKETGGWQYRSKMFASRAVLLHLLEKYSVLYFGFSLRRVLSTSVARTIIVLHWFIHSFRKGFRLLIICQKKCKTFMLKRHKFCPHFPYSFVRDPQCSSSHSLGIIYNSLGNFEMRMFKKPGFYLLFFPKWAIDRIQAVSLTQLSSGCANML